MNRHNVFELHIDGEQLPVTEPDSLTYLFTITSKEWAHCIRATAKGIATVGDENQMRSCCISLVSEDDGDGDDAIHDEEEEVGGGDFSECEPCYEEWEKHLNTTRVSKRKTKQGRPRNQREQPEWDERWVDRWQTVQYQLEIYISLLLFHIIDNIAIKKAQHPKSN